MQSQGTWLGVTRTGRLAGITNFREPNNLRLNAPSRGQLVSDFLLGREHPGDYCKRMLDIGHRYNGYNLILGNFEGLYHCSNRDDKITRLAPGYYGVSNHLLDTPWPKIERGKKRLKALLNRTQEVEVEALFDLLLDRTPFPDAQLPDTGVGPEWERILAPLFIESAIYGTRSSSVILIDRSGRLTFSERTHDPNPEATGQLPTRSFIFTISKS